MYGSLWHWKRKKRCLLKIYIFEVWGSFLKMVTILPNFSPTIQSFWPNVLNIWSLGLHQAQCIIKRGHKKKEKNQFFNILGTFFFSCFFFSYFCLQFTDYNIGTTLLEDIRKKNVFQNEVLGTFLFFFLLYFCIDHRSLYLTYKHVGSLWYRKSKTYFLTLLGNIHPW